MARHFPRLSSKQLKPAIARFFCASLFCLMIMPVASAKEVTLSLENADIQDLIQWASRHIDKTIIVHPNVKGKVSVLAGAPINEKEAYDVFMSVLQVHGFAVVETDQSIKILPDAIAKQSSPAYAGPDSLDEEIVVRLIKVKNVSAAPLVSLLRPLLPQVAHLGAYVQSNSLIVADRAQNINKIVKIVEDIDRVGTIDIEVIPLEFANAGDISGVLGKLIGQGQSNAEANPLTFVADERSNSILITGDPISRQQIKRLIQQLDKPLSGEGNTQVVYVYYANAVDLVPILQSVSGSLQKGDKDQPFDNTEVSIQASEANNALIITAPPALLNTIKGVIQKLDIRRKQVLVEAVIVEVNDDVADDLGIRWTSTVPQDGIFGGFDAFPSAVGGANNPAPPALGSGLTLGYFSNDSLRGLIRALETNSSANILSTPTIVTLDNEEAEILVGSNVPFVTGQTVGEDFTTDAFQTIERQDIGITLKVKPRINENDSMTLDIEQKVEDISTSTVAEDLITNKREIKTRVLLENDQVLVLGGLIEDQATQVESRVPILGRIPVVGRLFRSTSTKVEKNNLMVFIHPVILADVGQSNSATSQRYNDLRSKQQQYNKGRDHIFIPEEPPLLPELDFAETLPAKAAEGQQ
ncbi:MAG: type II secretion system secretin GspD [Pseudomonadales bacterium]